MKRTKLLLKIYFTGEVPPLTIDAVNEVTHLWRSLKSLPAKRVAFDKLEQSSVRRRASLGENAVKASSLFGAMAFAVTLVIGVVVLNPPLAVVVLAFLAIKFFILSSAIMITTISSKFKVMRRKKPRLAAIIQLEEVAASEEDGEGFEAPTLRAYLALAYQRHKRDMLLLVERRALWLSCSSFVLGLMIAMLAVDALLSSRVL